VTIRNFDIAPYNLPDPDLGRGVDRKCRRSTDLFGTSLQSKNRALFPVVIRTIDVVTNPNDDQLTARRFGRLCERRGRYKV
jgi:hypothetical protein